MTFITLATEMNVISFIELHSKTKKTTRFLSCVLFGIQKTVVDNSQLH